MFEYERVSEYTKCTGCKLMEVDCCLSCSYGLLDEDNVLNGCSLHPDMENYWGNYVCKDWTGEGGG